MEELTRRRYHQSGNKETGGGKKMEVLFRRATQAISDDILHQRQTVATAGQRAGMSASLASTPLCSVETKAKTLSFFFFILLLLFKGIFKAGKFVPAMIKTQLRPGPVTGPASEWIIRHNRTDSKVRTQIRSIHRANCWLKRLCGHIKPQQPLR